MTRLTTIFIGLFFLTSCDCYQSVSGTVVDKETGSALCGVTVYNKNKDWVKTTTDSVGHFELSNVSGGFRCQPMTVIAAMSKYNSSEVSIPVGEKMTLELKRELRSYLEESSCFSDADTLDGQTVYMVTQKRAEFPLGELEMIRYLTDSIKVPSDWDYRSVWLTFIIDSNGKVRNVCSAKRLNSDRLTSIEKECIRAVQAMPNWIPAEMGGEKVYSRQVLPIKFDLSNDD